jgi:antitoxin (DNA-binding transcriptional repressor) of toxin-antitoxin stability system
MICGCSWPLQPAAVVPPPAAFSMAAPYLDFQRIRLYVVGRFMKTMTERWSTSLMTTMTVTDFARHLSQVFDRLEYGGEEITLVRHRHAVAKLIPGAPAMSALEAFADLYGIMPEDEGLSWIHDSAGVDRSINDKELRDPWTE